MIDPIKIDFVHGLLAGACLKYSKKYLAEMEGTFHDTTSFNAMAREQLIYQVQYFEPVEEGTEGGLFFGATIIEPGKVGDEYFMTKGHFHRMRNRAEYYITVEGAGALVLMSGQGATRVQYMAPGSVHYIPGNTAHRVANVATNKLTFLACWPSDAGHDYETIEKDGFGARILERNGRPELVTE